MDAVCHAVEGDGDPVEFLCVKNTCFHRETVFLSALLKLIERIQNRAQRPEQKYAKRQKQQRDEQQVEQCDPERIALKDRQML